MRSLNPAEGQSFFFTIPQFIGLNISAPDSWPPGFQQALGNSTWLTFPTYPYYKGVELAKTAYSIDSLIFMCLIIKSMRYFQLLKVCQGVLQSIAASVLDLAGTGFICVQSGIGLGTMLMQLVGYIPRWQTLSTFWDMCFTVGYMGVNGAFGEQDFEIIDIK